MFSVDRIVGDSFDVEVEQESKIGKHKHESGFESYSDHRRADETLERRRQPTQQQQRRQQKRRLQKHGDCVVF